MVATEETVTNETGAGIALTRAENTRKHSVEEGFVSIKFKSREPVKNDSDGKAVVALNIQEDDVIGQESPEKTMVQSIEDQENLKRGSNQEVCEEGETQDLRQEQKMADTMNQPITSIVEETKEPHRKVVVKTLRLDTESPDKVGLISPRERE